MVLKNWKTSLGGASIILSALGKLISDIVNGVPVDFNVLFVALMTGVSLLFTKDFDVSGTKK